MEKERYCALPATTEKNVMQAPAAHAKSESLFFTTRWTVYAFIFLAGSFDNFDDDHHCFIEPTINPTIEQTNAYWIQFALKSIYPPYGNEHKNNYFSTRSIF